MRVDVSREPCARFCFSYERRAPVIRAQVRLILHALFFRRFCTSALALCPLRAPSYLCVLERDVLTLFAPSGRVYAVPLPFHGKRVWPLERGIIVERYAQTAHSLTRIHVEQL